MRTPIELKGKSNYCPQEQIMVHKDFDIIDNGLSKTTRTHVDEERGLERCEPSAE